MARGLYFLVKLASVSINDAYLIIVEIAPAWHEVACVNWFDYSAFPCACGAIRIDACDPMRTITRVFSVFEFSFLNYQHFITYVISVV